MAVRVHTTTVLVSDQDQAIAFWVDKIGFVTLADAPLGEQMRWVVVGPADGQTGLALMLPSHMSGQATPGGFTGISFITDDIVQVYERWSARGVSFSGPLQVMPWGARGTWFSDQDGNSFFLGEGEA